MTLVNPFIGTHPNRMVKWSNDKLEKTKDFIYPKDPKNQGFKHCIEGRWYTLIAGGILLAELGVNLVSLPFLILSAPVVRAPAVLCRKTENISIKNWIEKTDNWSAKKILLLAVRVLAVALAAIATLTVGVLISAGAAVRFQQFLQILNKDVPKKEAIHIEKMEEKIIHKKDGEIIKEKKEEKITEDAQGKVDEKKEVIEIENKDMKVEEIKKDIVIENEEGIIEEKKDELKIVNKEEEAKIHNGGQQPVVDVAKVA